MKRNLLSLALLLLAALAGGPAAYAQHDHAAEGDGPRRPLKNLMVALGQDMSRLGDGLLHEDYEMIHRAAQDIADHPRVTPEEMAAIRQALGDGFQAFVGFDVDVHETAVQIAEAAEARQLGRIVQHYARVQQGCIGCHTAYRAQVREALYHAPRR